MRFSLNASNQPIASAKLKCNEVLVPNPGHFSRMPLRIDQQAGSLQKVLSEQAFSVLIGTALPVIPRPWLSLRGEP